MVRVREDVHVHVPAAELRPLLDDPSAFEVWLGPQFSDLNVERSQWSLDLRLPGRRERITLRATPQEDGLVVYERADPASPVSTLSMALFSEGPREVHLTVEVEYEPAGGLLAPLLEPLLHRPHRAQALRDSLWKLKQHVESLPPTTATRDSR
jgi:hypothetical protein